MKQAGLGKEDAPSYTSAKTGMRFTVPRCFKYYPSSPLTLALHFLFSLLDFALATSGLAQRKVGSGGCPSRKCLPGLTAGRRSEVGTMLEDEVVTMQLRSGASPSLLQARRAT